MKTSTELLFEKMKPFMGSMLWIQPEVSDLSKLYWGQVNIDAAYTALAVGDPATLSTKLTKQEVLNALAWAEQLVAFFANTALTQSDYLLNLQGISYGNNAAASALSPAIEDFGERSVTLANSSIQLLDDAKDILDVYFDNEISAAIGAVTGEEVPWYTFSKSDFTEGVSLIEAFRKLIDNQVATQADYSSTAAKWSDIISS
jgi:hypothetical protein